MSLPDRAPRSRIRTAPGAAGPGAAGPGAAGPGAAGPGAAGPGAAGPGAAAVGRSANLLLAGRLDSDRTGGSAEPPGGSSHGTDLAGPPGRDHWLVGDERRRGGHRVQCVITTQGASNPDLV